VADFGGVVDAVIKGRQYKSAQWNKIPGPYLVESGLNSRQIALYVRLSAKSNSGKEFDGARVLRDNETMISIRDEARRERVSEWTVREDLRRLRKLFLVNVHTCAGKRALVTVVDPKFIPAIGALARRDISHRTREELYGIIEELCDQDAVDPRTSSHSTSLEEQKKILLKQLISDVSTHSPIALDLSIERGTLEKISEETRCENSPASAGPLPSGPSGAEVARETRENGPLARPEAKGGPSGLPSDLGSPQAGEGRSAAAGEGWDGDFKTPSTHEERVAFFDQVHGVMGTKRRVADAAIKSAD